MSAIKEAAANTVFRIANMFEQNCALKYGIPKVGGPDRIDAEPPATPAPAPPINITNNIPAAPAATSSPSPGLGAALQQGGRSLLRRAAPFLLTAALGGGISSALMLLLQKDAPVVEQTEQEKDGSLLQYLQDKGQHLREGAWPTN